MRDFSVAKSLFKVLFFVLLQGVLMGTGVAGYESDVHNAVM